MDYSNTHRRQRHRHNSHYRELSARTDDDLPRGGDLQADEHERSYGGDHAPTTHPSSRRRGFTSGSHSHMSPEYAVFFNVDGLPLYHRYESDNGYVPGSAHFRRGSFSGTSRRSFNSTDITNSTSEPWSSHGSVGSGSYDSSRPPGQGQQYICDTSDSGDYTNLADEYYGGRQSPSYPRSSRDSSGARSFDSSRSQGSGSQNTPDSRSTADYTHSPNNSEQYYGDRQSTSRRSSTASSAHSVMVRVFYFTWSGDGGAAENRRTEQNNTYHTVGYEDVPRHQIAELDYVRVVGDGELMPLSTAEECAGIRVDYEYVQNMGPRRRRHRRRHRHHRSSRSSPRDAPRDSTGGLRMGFIRNLFHRQ